MDEKNGGVLSPKPAKKGKKAIVALIIVLVLLCALAAAGYFAYYYYETEISGGERVDEMAVFTVKNGEAYSTVGKRLEEEGFIGSELIFKS